MNININISSLSSSVKKMASLLIILPIGFVCILIVLLIAHRLSDRQKHFISLRQNLNSYREALWKVKNVEVQKLNQEIVSVYQRFPSAEKLSLVIKEITEKAKDYNIKVISITPGEKTDVDESEKPALSGLNRIQLSMRLEGSYENLASFLMNLSALTNGIIKTNHFHLEKADSKTPDLTLVLDAALYVRRTDVEELFQEVAPDESPALNKKTVLSRFQTYLRNPFVEEIIIGTPKLSFHLEGILYDSAQPIALINGEGKRVGDEVQHAKILEIRPDSVLMQKENEQFEVKLRHK